MHVQSTDVCQHQDALQALSALAVCRALALHAHLISDCNGFRDHYNPKDDTSIPTGDFEPVKGTPYDFTEPKRIGEQVARLPDGVDHNFVLFGKVTSARAALYAAIGLAMQDD